MRDERHAMGETGQSVGGSSTGPLADAIAALDMIASRRPMNDELLVIAGQRSLKDEIGRTLRLVEALDIDALVARQSWLSRFTGAALEAQLEFEIAARRVSASFDILEQMAIDADRRIALIKTERESLVRSLAEIDGAIATGQAVLAGAGKDEPHLRARLERKLGDLMAIRTANALAIPQFRLAENSLAELNDRFRQIATVLFPLWQQRLFALLHAPKRLTRSDPDVTDFQDCHLALNEYFQAEARA